jgi:hypothetical protein
MALDSMVCPIIEIEREHMAKSATDSFGFCGVGIPGDETWMGVILVTSSTGIPRTHPVSASGINNDTAALMTVFIASESIPIPIAKKLCQVLVKHLRTTVNCLEAQASPPGIPHTVLTPAPSLLLSLGFQPIRYPAQRYRLTFSSLASWMYNRLEWFHRPGIQLSDQPANRTL